MDKTLIQRDIFDTKPAGRKSDLESPESSDNLPTVDDFFSVTDWLSCNSWTTEDDQIAPLFWLLNSLTFDARTADRIASWRSQLLKTKKIRPKQRRSGEEIAVERWSDLLQAFELETFGGQKSSKSDHMGLSHQTLSCLAAAYWLPRVVKLEGEEAILPTIEVMIAATSQIRIRNSKSILQPWFEQILAVELPLVLAHRFPDFVVTEDLCDSAAEWLSAAIDEHLDSDGCPSASLLPIFGPLVASWLRSAGLMRQLKWKLTPAVNEQLAGAVLHLLNLLRGNRQLMFSDDKSASLTMDCLKRMSQLLDSNLPRKLINGLRKNKKANEPDLLQVKQPSGSSSGWGLASILRANWQPGAGRVGLAFSGHSCHCEIGSGETLIFGDSMPEIKFNGRTITPLEEFSVACEEFDDEINFVELQMELSQGVTLHRQWLLILKDQLLYVADCIHSTQAGSIEYRCDWPLSEGITALPEIETRELYLQTNKIQALVLPLSLPEWLVGPTTGSLTYSEQSNSIRLTEKQSAGSLCVPLVFDLCCKRSRQKRTWRQLTVAESGKPVSRDTAAAFRFQIGKEQWLSYRALGSKGMRSFFGEHFSGEFLFARFNRKGDLKELLRIP
jgi:hypothetical protein